MKIIVSLRSKWGKDLFYPVSADAKFLTQLTGRPTLLKQQLKLCAERGYDVSIVQDPIDFDKIFDESE